MEFLSNAIISSASSTIIGALITTFNPEDYQSRAEMKLYSVEDLARDYPNMVPRGFKFEPPGILYSDVTVMSSISDSVYSFIEDECAGLGVRNLDISDFVLRGVDRNGCVFVNFEEMRDDLTEESFNSAAVTIPFKHFRVSNSSFNIYASYRPADDSGYRTFSLLHLEDGSASKFYAMFSGDVDVSDFKTGVKAVKSLEINGVENIIYEVELGLNGFYGGVGEAFLNFLSYGVAFYNIGEKLIKDMQNVMPKIPALPVDEQAPRHTRRARVNVSIQHVYKEVKLEGILRRLSDEKALLEYRREVPEADISYQWLHKIYQSPWYLEGEGKLSEEECIYTACTNLLPICRCERLKYALELLTHRYYIYMLGIVNDTLGPVLKGGGVCGESLKRVTFR